MLHSEGASLYDQLVRQGALDQHERWPNLTVEQIPSRDHTFRALWLQRHVHESLDRALDRVLGGRDAARGTLVCADDPARVGALAGVGLARRRQRAAARAPARRGAPARTRHRDARAGQRHLPRSTAGSTRPRSRSPRGGPVSRGSASSSPTATGTRSPRSGRCESSRRAAQTASGRWPGAGRRLAAPRSRTPPTARPARVWWRSAGSRSRPTAAARRGGRGSRRRRWSCPSCRWHAAATACADRQRRGRARRHRRRISRRGSRRGLRSCARAPLPLLDPAPAGEYKVLSPMPPVALRGGGGAGACSGSAPASSRRSCSRARSRSTPRSTTISAAVLGAAARGVPVLLRVRGRPRRRDVHRGQPRAAGPPRGPAGEHGRARRLLAAERRPGGRRAPRRAAAAAATRTARRTRSSCAASPARCGRTRCG